MSIDVDYYPRLQWLAELMLIDPDKPVKRLQWEALKLYPLASKEAIRRWMDWSVVFAAADIANQSLEIPDVPALCTHSDPTQ